MGRRASASARSPAASICHRADGGSGCAHARAAGATIEGPVAEARPASREVAERLAAEVRR